MYWTTNVGKAKQHEGRSDRREDQPCRAARHTLGSRTRCAGQHKNAYDSTFWSWRQNDSFSGEDCELESGMCCDGVVKRNWPLACHVITWTNYITKVTVTSQLLQISKVDTEPCRVIILQRQERVQQTRQTETQQDNKVGRDTFVQRNSNGCCCCWSNDYDDEVWGD